MCWGGGGGGSKKGTTKNLHVKNMMTIDMFYTTASNGCNKKYEIPELLME